MSETRSRLASGETDWSSSQSEMPSVRPAKAGFSFFGLVGRGTTIDCELRSRHERGEMPVRLGERRNEILRIIQRSGLAGQRDLGRTNVRSGQGASDKDFAKSRSSREEAMCLSARGRISDLNRRACLRQAVGLNLLRASRPGGCSCERRC